MAPTSTERLREVPLFSEVSDDALRLIADIASEVEVPAGQLMIQSQDPGLGMFVVEEGQVVVELRDHEVTLGPGEFFGELALLIPEGTRAARVRALTNVRCLAIERSDFVKLLEHEPAIPIAMLPVLARRLSDEIRSH
jgi:CRP-like cAMP-binding protein